MAPGWSTRAPLARWSRHLCHRCGGRDARVPACRLCADVVARWDADRLLRRTRGCGPQPSRDGIATGPESAPWWKTARRWARAMSSRHQSIGLLTANTSCSSSPPSWVCLSLGSTDRDPKELSSWNKYVEGVDPHWSPDGSLISYNHVLGTKLVIARWDGTPISGVRLRSIGTLESWAQGTGAYGPEPRADTAAHRGAGGH